MVLSEYAFLILLFSSLASGTFTYVDRYEEMQRLGNPCFPRDTCRSLKSESEDNMWQRNRTCECGEHCVRHQTCCIDSNYFGMNQFAPKGTKEVCHEVPTRDFLVYMVSTCLTEWHKDYTYDKCVQQEIDLKDPLSQAPVTSTTSGTTYANYFCALCNNDADSAIIWDIGLSITKNPNFRPNAMANGDDVIEKLEYNSALSSWGYFHVDQIAKRREFKRIPITFFVKDDLKKFVKPCHPGIISKCSSSYKSTRLRYKCEAYYSPIEGRKRGSKDGFMYRNIHCALCNGLRANIDEFVCLPETKAIRHGPSLSFTKLLDINRKDGENVGKTRVCKDGQVFDPFFKKCRSLVCSMPNYVKKNGACVKSD